MALLIGAAEYGEGFETLPAVRNDIRLMSEALTAVGYNVTVCHDEDVSNAGRLDRCLREFVRSGGPEDVRLLYFSGHGMRIDQADWIIPAGARRRDAVDSSTQRVSTDLSATVADSKVGLVVFVIDACRDPSHRPATKGAYDPASDLKRPAEERFVRYFGCASEQVCQVLGSSDAGKQFSLFTKALTESLADPTCVTLEAWQKKTEDACNLHLAGDPQLDRQTPRLSYGELSNEKAKMLQRIVFDPIAQNATASVWDEFDPNKLHCLVVSSEREAGNAPSWGVVHMVRNALSGKSGSRIWNAFCAAQRDSRLISGKTRSLEDTFTPGSVALASFTVLEAFVSDKALVRAVRAVVEADLVVFDVTLFEPAIMLLLGIRSACRRALTVCSHGAKWREGMPLRLPFNLQDLSVNSHTPRARDDRIGDDPVVERFVKRVTTGFEQVALHPAYVDLPGYEELRQLGATYEAARTIDGKEKVLVLCSFGEDFFDNWRHVKTELADALWLHPKRAQPKIERIIDYGSSQIVRQALYEQIRRTHACVVDWSGFRASVFFELGARLAVSEYGAVHLIDESYRPRQNSQDIEPDAMQLKQVAFMRRLLEPIPYLANKSDPTAFQRAAAELLDRDPSRDTGRSYNLVHRTVLEVIGRVQALSPTVDEDLLYRADALHHTQQSREGAPQALFFGDRATKSVNKRAALEMRLAAWLYLEHRGGAAQRASQLSLATRYRTLGKEVVGGLYELGDDGSFALAEMIEKRLKQSE